MSNPTPADPYNLARFVSAQAATYETALAELRSGRKQSHWMWYIFPQLRGLGRSPTSQFYGLSGIEEAIAYHQHPILGARLHESCEALLQHRDRTATQIFGRPDDRKLQSSLTLFAAAAPQVPIFQQLLDQFFNGRPDPQSLIAP